ncbi:MAG: hypothetical protein MUO77_05990 [Anaerolineales bacterium]|nr:hypothetical protein [Anaerolineales bacterium]
MKKTIYLLLAMTIFVTLFASACGGSAAPATQAAPPPVQIVPTNVVPLATAQQPAPPVQAFAPACQATTSCAAPAVDEMDTEVMKTYCVKKVPYQNILVPPGTTFETLDPSGDFKCQDSGTVENGKAVLSCTGKNLWTYELKLINPACSASALTTGTGQCQEGLGYDAAQNCCAPLTGSDSGSVTIKVNLGSCE